MVSLKTDARPKFTILGLLGLAFVAGMVLAFAFLQHRMNAMDVEMKMIQDRYERIRVEQKIIRKSYQHFRQNSPLQFVEDADE